MKAASPQDVPSTRLAWLFLGLAGLMIVIAVALFLVTRSERVEVNVEGTPTPNPVARAATVDAGPPPTFTPVPGIPFRTPTPLPTDTPAPTPRPTATRIVLAAPTRVVIAATEPPAPTATPPPPPPPATPVPPSPTPAPFAGQVSGPGGLGNTRADLDAAYGGSVGQTPEMLVAYRKTPFEYHVGFSPGQDRAVVIVELPQSGQPELSQTAAIADARKFFPTDTQPRAAQPEGNAQFVVERFTSQKLAQAVGPEVFQDNQGQPGDFLVVYVRDTQQSGRISRTILGPGNDPNPLLSFR